MILSYTTVYSNLFNRKDELINEINYPVLRVNYGYVGGGGYKEFLTKKRVACM